MPTFTIVSFNAHGGLRPYRDRTCRPYDLRAVLASFAADVIVVQESWWPDEGTAAVDDVADDLGAKVFALPFGRGSLAPWPHVPRNGSGNGMVGLAVLTTLPAQEVARLPVGRVLADPAPERGALCLELDVGGTTVDLVGLHLSSRLPYGPPLQLRRLAPLLPPPGRPAVVTGDCNFWGPGVCAFLPGWRRAVIGRTWPARMPHSQIDHILVRPEVGVVDSEVLPDVGSDHRPVRATLSA
ncbi:MAG TPA: endonuclease/exonuclease/phosphatase family protein [Acidimicrobiia bacterium]|nr:endonuclease/exonuclease/phosphatase family protein [Acidimicrobiia bacterium]